MKEYHIRKYKQYFKQLNITTNKKGENFLFRLESTYFHFELIADYRYQLITKSYGAETEEDIIKKALYVFEDTINNLTTFYDYLANLIIDLLRAEKKKIKWNSLVKTLRAQPNYLGIEELEKEIISHHRFVNRLLGYRSEIIHYNIDSVRQKIRESLPTTISTPVYFDKKIGYSKRISNYQDMDLLSVSSFITFQVIEFGETILCFLSENKDKIQY